MTRAGIIAAIDREADVLAEVLGDQDHPNGTGPDRMLLEVLPRYSNLRDNARALADIRSAIGDVSHADLLLETVFAALAEDDPAKLTAELVKLAGTATRWIEAIDRAEATR
jgi:hypothetical protein